MDYPPKHKTYGRLYDQRGYTLLEVVIAIAILGIALAGLTAALGSGVIGSDRVMENTRLLNLARSQQEFSQAQTFASSTGSSVYTNITDVPEGYGVTTTVSAVTSGLLEQITVDVAGDNESLNLSTYRADRQDAAGKYPRASGFSVVRQAEVPSPLAADIGYFKVVDVVGSAVPSDLTAEWLIESSSGGGEDGDDDGGGGITTDIEIAVYSGKPFGSNATGTSATQPGSVVGTRVASARTSRALARVIARGVSSGSYTIYFFNHDNTQVLSALTPVSFFDLSSSDDTPIGIDYDGTSVRVVDADSGNESVYEYTLDGALQSSFGLDSANGDPKGIASDGSSIWVVDDADNKVYQYTTAGTLTTSWSLNASNNDPDGIAEVSSNLYVLDDDSGTEKVFKYTSAGTLITSFSLDAANSTPRGVGADGTSVWVVDNSSGPERVYKYSDAGTLLTTLALRSANAIPSGLTLHGSDIVVVDDSSTERGFIYKAAAATKIVCVCPESDD